MLDELRTALDSMSKKHLDELRRLVEIPSVSAEGRGISECAAEVSNLLEARDLEVKVHPTAGNPIIVATGGCKDGPMLMFYLHYDVQPPDPLERWSYPPFEVTENNGSLFGRGTSDDKAHIICRLAAIDAVREVSGGDPVGYCFVIEGEEEIGSVNMESFVKDHKDELKADACVWEFGGVDKEGRPTVSIGLKGVVSLELHASVPSYDAHSSLGVVMDNPLYRIAAAVASLRDVDGRVTIDGFYDDVVPLTQAELDALAAEPDQTEELRKNYGVKRFFGDATGTELRRRLAAEPCVNINGIHGGYGGPGSKTVLPATAFAKLDIRLVVRQDPHTIMRLVREHLDRHGFEDVETVALAGEAAGKTPLDDPFVKIVYDTARTVYGSEPVVSISSAGSGPSYPFREYLGVPFASCGCAYPGSRAHAPDEHIRIQDFDNGKLHTAMIIAKLGGAIT